MSGLAPAIHASERGIVLRPDEARVHEARSVRCCSALHTFSLFSALHTFPLFSALHTFPLHQSLSPHELVNVLTLSHSFPRRAELLAMAPALENGYVRVPKTGIGADAIGE